MGMTDATEIAPHTWYSHTTGSVLHDVSRAVEPLEPMVVEGIELLPKQEFHTTLVSARRELHTQKREAHFIHDLREFLAYNPVELRTITNERYFCQKENEASVIAPVCLFGDVGLKSFVRKFIPQYDPFYHVTLLKSEETEHGIRISSRDDLNDRCTLL